MLLNQNKESWKTIWKQVPLWTAILLLIMIPLVLITGYTHWDPKLPFFAFVWLPTNLLFVCMPEEVFYRGFILTRTQHYQNHDNIALPVLLSAILFGVSHISGGILYVLFATLAGCIYGLAYIRTNRIETSILTHFSFNTLHFFLFTYPALA